MQSFPIDHAKLPQLSFLAVSPKIADRATGTQKTNALDIPVWSVQVLVAATEDRQAELETISVPAKIAPSFDPMTVLSFENLRGFFWQMNGRAGVSMTAESVDASDELTDLLND